MHQKAAGESPAHRDTENESPRRWHLREGELSPGLFAFGDSRDMAERVFATARATGPIREEELMGHTYQVFPATLVREGVLNNNLGATFLPAEEIEASVESWSGMPVTLGHPKRRGQPTSARDPEVLNDRGAGFVFRPRFDEDDRALKADVFIDPDRAENVEALDGLVEKVERGEPAELSTGFGTALEEHEDTHNGERYDRVLRSISPDHLALLDDERGACSVEDGCGLGMNEEDEEDGDGVDAEPRALAEADPDTIVDRVVSAVRNAFGPGEEEDDPAENQDEMSLDDIREAVSDHLDEVFGAQDRFIHVVELFSDEVVYEVAVQGGEDRLFRAPYEVNEDGEVTLGERTEVEKRVEFVPTENEWSAQTEYRTLATNCKECDMTREELIAALADDEDVAFDREALESFDDNQLATVANGAGLEVEGEADAETDDPEPTDADSAEAEALLEEVSSLKEKVAELEDATEPAVEEREEERRKLAEQLAANERCPFEAEELESESLSKLRKMAQMARGVNYAGRGGPKSTAENTEERFLAPTPYHEQDEE